MARKTQSKPPLRLEYIEAGTLTANPANWRRHPQSQVKALKSVLRDVGFAGALLFNEATGRLIDGHARKDAVEPSTPVPVLVGSWTEEQEQKILATLDPIGAMAVADGDALESLLAEIDLDTNMEDLSAMLDGMIEDAEGPDPRPVPERNAAEMADRHRGERITTIIVGHLKFEIPRKDFDVWLAAVEEKVGNDPDRVIREIKRRLKLRI